MKKIWNWIKFAYGKSWEIVLKNYNAVCVGLVLTCVYFSLTIVKNAEHAEREFGLLKDSLELQVVIKEQSFLIKEQNRHLTEVFNLATEQGMEIRNQEDQMRELKSTLYNLKLYYDTLIEYMKKIDEWPPKEEPPFSDPDKITRSEAKYNGPTEGSGSI
jgi:hypothetical protein